jgi:outer membrane protein assembly factor BamB
LGELETFSVIEDPTLVGSSIALTLSPWTPVPGGEFSLSGNLSFDDGSIASGAAIGITVRPPAGPRITLPTAITDERGNFTAGPIAQLESGPYTVEATFPGDESHRPSLAEQSVLAIPPFTLRGTDMAVTYQVSALHDGQQPTDAAVPPLVPAWQQELPEEGSSPSLSYPVIAEGRVFITSEIVNFTDVLYALDLYTGEIAWGPIDIGGSGHWSALAYDAGRIFTINNDGGVRSFSARTGAELWSNDEVECPVPTPPTVGSHLVYVPQCGILFAFDKRTGEIRWSADTNFSGTGAAVFDGKDVYLGGYLRQAYKFDNEGGLLWHRGGGFGYGETSVLHDGLLYVREETTSTEAVLDATDGSLVDDFEAFPAPAFEGPRGFFLSGRGNFCASWPNDPPCTLTAIDLRSGTVLWSFAGNGALVTAPVVVHGIVYVGAATGQLYGLDAKTGRLVWSYDLAQALPGPDEHNRSGPLTGLSAGGGYLVVPVLEGQSPHIFRLIAFHALGGSPTFSPQALSYGPTEVGASSPMQIHLRNTGATPLHVERVRVGGHDPGDFSLSWDGCTDRALLPGKGCAVTVVFAPTATGKRSAVLLFADDGPGGIQKAQLSGKGL